MENNQILLSSNEQLKILNRFLVNNPELEELSAKLAVFNILKVLRIEKAEIRHSNVLAWLMNPQESHGIGQAFLQRILSTIMLDNRSWRNKLTSAQIELMNLRGVEVRREWRKIDLIVIDEDNKWVLLIENKVKAKATKKQLLNYLDVVKKEFTKFDIVPVLLTMFKDDGWDIAEATGYIPWSYSQTFDVIKQIKRQRQDRIPEDANIFLEHYLLTLRRLTMQDDEIVGLCKTIYKKHKDAIDLIVEWGAANQFAAVADEFMAEHNELTQLHLDPKWLWFVDKKWESIMPACSDSWKHLSKPYPVACWFRLSAKTSKLSFIIEVGSIEDSKKRLNLIETFQEEGFKFGKMAFRPESSFTRVYSIRRKIDDPDDQEELKKTFDELWINSADALKSTSKVIQSFNW